MNHFKCNDCGAEITPEWKHCLTINQCPGCSGKIMTDAQQELILELGNAMSEMPNDPVGVAGWLVTNYSIKKVGDCVPVNKFYDKENKQELVSPEQSNDFFKRSGYDIDKIKEAEARKNSLANGGDITEMDFTDEIIDNDYDNNPIDEINNILNSNIQNTNNDTAKARAYIEQKRLKQLEAQHNISNGVGAISRTGQPAGFRRSS